MRAVALAFVLASGCAAVVGSRPAVMDACKASGLGCSGGSAGERLVRGAAPRWLRMHHLGGAATRGGCAAGPRGGEAPPRGARARRGGAVGRGGGRRFVRGAVPCWLRRVHLSGVAGCAAAGAREVERLHDTGLTVPILCRPPRSSCSSLHARAGVAHAPAPLVVLGAACLRAAPVRLVVATSPDYRSSSSSCADATLPCA